MRAFVRPEERSFFLKMKTRRYFCRFMSDPETMYRKRVDIKMVRETRDCILLLCKCRLLELGATEHETTAVEDPMCATWLRSRRPRLGLHPRPISTFSLPTRSLARYDGLFFLRFVNEPGPAIYL